VKGKSLKFASQIR